MRGICRDRVPDPIPTDMMAAIFRCCLFSFWAILLRHFTAISFLQFLHSVVDLFECGIRKAITQFALSQQRGLLAVVAVRVEAF